MFASTIPWEEVYYYFDSKWTKTKEGGHVSSLMNLLTQSSCQIFQAKSNWDSWQKVINRHKFPHVSVQICVLANEPKLGTCETRKKALTLSGKYFQ